MSSDVPYFVSALAWDEVARRLRNGPTAILPVGAGAKQHGLHLPMGTDQIQAEWFAARLAARANALIWPTLTYGTYPAFAAYAGSASLSARAFESLVGDIVERLVAYGARDVLVLNTGISTIAPIEAAIRSTGGTDRVRHCCIYTGARYLAAAAGLRQQSYGSHADEMETSVMLQVAPDLVQMARAEASPPSNNGPVDGPLTPHDPSSPNYSPSGSFGDPTKASPEKGRVLVAAILEDLFAVANELRV